MHRVRHGHPDVSRWLGHKDGGALATKTYGHLRNEHSQQVAQEAGISNLESYPTVI